MRRALVIAGATIALLSVAPPAEAHTVTGVEPTNYASRILAVRPSVPGLSLRLLDLGRRVEVRNRTDEDVVVIGYYGEPYLRVGPAGAFENRTSPTRRQNRVSTVTTATTTPATPAAADLEVPPSWRRIRGEPVVRWADQRTRYEGPRLSGPKRNIGGWNLVLRRGETDISVSGLLTYVPGQSPLPWVVLTLALAALATAAAWTKQWGRWLSVALGVLLASDMIHTFGSAAATYESLAAQMARVLLAGLVTTLAWIIGVAAIPSLQRNHEGGLVTAGGVGLVIGAFSGITDLGVFANSQVPSVFPAVAARISVALALGLGVGLVAAAIAVIARDPALRPTMAVNNEDTDR